MLLLIKNGTVINPGDKTEQKADVLVEDGIISMEQAKERIKEKEEEFILWYQEHKKR